MHSLEMKVDALMRLCTAENEESRAEAMATCRGMLDKTTAKAWDLDMAIRRLLIELGVPDHIVGKNYLVSAIKIAAKDQTVVKAITSQLYPTVAKEFDTTPSRVERAIRHAIEVAWDRGDMDVLAEYFGNTISPNKGKPTNSEFIARIANEVRAWA